MDMDLMKEFVAKTQEKRALQAQLKPIADRLGDLEMAIVEQFQGDTVKSMVIDGYNMHLKREISVKSKTGDMAAIVAAVTGTDLDYLLGINQSKVKAWAKECCLDEATGEWEPDACKLPASIR